MTLPEIAQNLEALRVQIVAVTRAIGAPAVQAQLDLMQAEAQAAARKQIEETVATRRAEMEVSDDWTAVDVASATCTVIGVNAEGVPFMQPVDGLHPAARAAFVGAAVPSEVTFEIDGQPTTATISQAFEPRAKGPAKPRPDARAIRQARKRR